jgi:hypothetical protein
MSFEIRAGGLNRQTPGKRRVSCPSTLFEVVGDM